MKKFISVVVVLFIVCSLFTSCGFDDTSVKAELVGTWMMEKTYYFDDFYMVDTYFNVYYPTGKFYRTVASQYYHYVGKPFGDARPFEYNGTYKITQDKIIMTYDDGDTTELSYLWNNASGKITQLESYAKISNSTNYLYNYSK